MITNCQDNKISGRRSVSDRRVFADPNYKGLERRVNLERRKGTRERSHQRFRVKEGAYAALKDDYNILGTIKDISKGGLSFQYFVREKKVSGSLTIDIFRNGKEFYLKNIPFKITSDFPESSKVPFSTIMLRNCGGKFSVLTAKQMSKLDHFIKNYTLG